MTFEKRLIVLVGAGGASGTIKTLRDGRGLTATLNAHGLSGGGYELVAFYGDEPDRYPIPGDIARERTLRLKTETPTDTAHFAIYGADGKAALYGTRAKARMKSMPLLPGKGEKDATSESDKTATDKAAKSFEYTKTETVFGDIFPSGEGYADNAVASVNYYAGELEPDEREVKPAGAAEKLPETSVSTELHTLSRNYVESFRARRAPVKTASFSAARAISDIQADYVRSLRASCRAHTARAQSVESAPIPTREPKIKGRKLTFYERIADEIDELFRSGERDETLEKLLPQTKWARVDYSESKRFFVGLVGDKPDYVCYALPGTFTVPAPEYLGEATFLPLDPADPEGKGYWLLYQSAADGSSVTLP